MKNSKIALIIPLHNQSFIWEKILFGINHQTLIPNNIYLIIDRPQYDKGPLQYNNSLYGIPLYSQWNALEKIKEVNSKIRKDINLKIIIIDKEPNNIEKNDTTFLGGYARNIGLAAALKDECNIFIFIDGDCVPQNNLVKSHYNICKINLPILSVGRRRESKYRWMDERETLSEFVPLQLFKNKGTLIENPILLKKCLIVWSCNIALNLNAVKLIYKFNEKYYGKSELFNSNFNGKWGGEDSFLGITAWYCHIFIQTIGDIKSGIEHIDHFRNPNIYTINHKDFFNKQCALLGKKIFLNPITLDLLNYNN